MRINQTEAIRLSNVLPDHVTHQGCFTSTGLPDDVSMEQPVGSKNTKCHLGSAQGLTEDGDGWGEGVSHPVIVSIGSVRT